MAGGGVAVTALTAAATTVLPGTSYQVSSHTTSSVIGRVTHRVVAVGRVCAGPPRRVYRYHTVVK